MDSNNFVAPAPGGGYTVYVGGKQVGTYPSQSAAENAYNAANGPSGSSTSAGGTYNTPNGPKTLAQMRQELQTAGWNGNYNDDATVVAQYNSTASGVGATDKTGQDWQNMMDAIASGDTQKFNESVREFNADLAEKQREFDTNQSLDKQKLALSQQQAYSQTAQNLLDTAAKLSGPADYYQYQQYLGGGKNLMNTLFGNQPLAAFQTPKGTLVPQSIQNLMQEMGFRQIPGGGTTASGQPAGGAAGQYYTKNGWKSVQDMLNELKGANWPDYNKWSGNPASQDAINAITQAYGNTTGGPVTPYQAPASGTPVSTTGGS